MNQKRLTTHDIVLMALLAVGNGVLTVFTAYINKMLTAAGGPIATSTITGIYMVYGVLAMYIIRKPGAAFGTYMIGATVQSLFGISYGAASAYVAALCYAVIIETVFALFRYKRWGYGAVSLASLLAVPLWFVGAAYMYGYWEWDGTVSVLGFEMHILLAALIVRCISGIVLCGILTKMIGVGLERAGWVKLFAAGREYHSAARVETESV